MMPWERFDPSLAKNGRGRSRSGVPKISITSAGSFLLNSAVRRLLSDPAAVRLLFDAEGRRIGFEAADINDPVAYKVSAPTHTVSGRRLLKSYGITHEETQRYGAKTQGHIVYIELDEHDGPRRR